MNIYQDIFAIFDTVTWGQQITCRCCLPTNYQALIVELTCEDGKNFRKQIMVPTACSCDTKSQPIKNRKIGTNTKMSRDKIYTNNKY